MIHGSPLNPLPLQIPIGVDWIIRGVLSSEAGFDQVIASKTEPVPGAMDAFSQHAEALDDAGIARVIAEDDTISVGLVRAGLRSGKRILSLFDLRGILQSFEVISDVVRRPLVPSAASVIVVCDSRWRDYVDRRDGMGELQSVLRNPVATQKMPVPMNAVRTSDPQRLAQYLGTPILAPSTPREVASMMNDAARLSMASRRWIMVLLSPGLVGGGETDWDVVDHTLRAVPSAIRETTEEDSNSLLVESRRLQIDRMLNTPVPGDTASLGFITFGSAHASLRQTLSDSGLTGYFPILKLGLANPIDPRSLRQFLTRCKMVIVVEGGESVIELRVLAESQRLSQLGLSPARVFGSRLFDPDQPREQRPGSHCRIPRCQELNSSLLLSSLQRILRHEATSHHSESHRQIDTADEAIRASQMIVVPKSKREDRALSTTQAPPGNGLPTQILHHVLQELRDELSEPRPKRPPLQLKVESAETASFDSGTDERRVIFIQRRRLATVGRSAILHAIRYRLHVTFVILPAVTRNREIPRSADADRMIRGMIADAETAHASVGSLDSTDAGALLDELRNAVLSPIVSVLVVNDDPSTTESTDSATLPEGEQTTTVDHFLVPSSNETTLHLEWLLRRGLQTGQRASGQQTDNGASILRAGCTSKSARFIDSWDGFTEYRVYQKAGVDSESANVAAIPAPQILHAQSPFWRVHVCGQAWTTVRQTTQLLTTAGHRMGYRMQLHSGRDTAGFFTQLVFSRPREGKPVDPITAHIPYGEANLVLAFDDSSLCEAIASTGVHHVARSGQTTILLDSSTIDRQHLAEAQANIPEAETTRDLRWQEVRSNTGLSIEMVSVGANCASTVRGSAFPSAALTGFAFQKGFVPISADALMRAGQSSSRAHAQTDRSQGETLQSRGIREGRAYAIAHQSRSQLDSATIQPINDSPPRTIPTRRSPEHLIRKHTLIMSNRIAYRAGFRTSEFQTMAMAALDSVTGLRRGDATRSSEIEFAEHLIECELWGGLPACRVFASLVGAVCAAESHDDDLQLTRMVITELARAMIVADMMFLCESTLRPDRLREIRRQLKVQSDRTHSLTVRIRFRCHQRWIRSLIGPYWKLAPIPARLVSFARPLRWLPWWARADQEYRKWVIRLTEQCIDEIPAKRSVWLEVFRQLSRVHGPRHIRHRRMRHVRHAVQSLLDISTPTPDSVDS